ncbi:MAG: transcriptional regulator [Pseudopedobacter saltans]|uniref:Transcriptional regulator n=1 Tax=Pseudopedobacter saltans TaxID=151895 RepID=A0A2W5FB27_9SPHI|nr:MAG: transcriptional regulator [Pseudopedobacter saltans]
MEFESMAQRHAYILKVLQSEDSIKVADLEKKLKVSLVTIRKDLKILEQKKLLFRTHGFITKSDPYPTDINVNLKEEHNKEAKIRIGEAAAKMIDPKSAILIASGTTVLQMARAIQIPDNQHLTVVTSAMNVAMALRDKLNIEIIQLGGIVRHSSTSVVGPFAEKMLQDLSFSTLFLGVDGLEAAYGLSTSNMLEAKLNAEMIKVAQKTVVLTDSSKFGKRGFGRICGLNDIDHIVTDTGISQQSIKRIEATGVELTIV